MKRTTYFILVIVALATAGIFLLPYLVSGESINQRLSARILKLTDNRLVYKGNPKLTLNPFLGIKLSDVSLVGKKNKADAISLIHIEELKFNLKLLPLLFGKVRLSGFELVRPKFNVTVDENGNVNWIKNVSANVTNSDNPNESPIQPIQLGQFGIIDGIVVTSIHGKPDPVRISNLNASISWPNLGSAWEISGDGVWSGEKFEFQNTTADPMALFSSGSSAVNIQFQSPALIVSFDGTANTASSIQLRGKSNIEIPSLPRLIDLIGGVHSAIKPPIGEMRIEGNMTVNTHEIEFYEANFNLGDNAATGNLQFLRRGEQRAKVSGTLAFASLNITPFVDALTARPSPGETNVKNTDAGTLDLDVRFSAQNYQLGSNSFGSMAATVLVKGSDWTFDIGEAEFFDGKVVGTIACKSFRGHDEIELKGTIRNVSMGNIAGKLHGGDIFASGIANIDFNFKAKDNSALNDFRKFSGSMSVSMPDGILEGLDIIKAVPALDENNGLVTFDEVKGSTPFGKLALELLVHNGIGWISKGIATNGSNELRLSGKADLMRGGLAIYTDIRKLNETDSRSQHSRIFIGGSIRNPLITRTPVALNRPDERPKNDG